MPSYQQSFLMKLQTPFSSSWLRPTWFTAPAAKNHIYLAWMEKRNVERFLKAVSRWNRYHRPLICENEAAKIRPSCQSLWCHCWQPKHSVLLILSFAMLPHAHQCQVYNWFQCYKYIYKVSTLSLHYTYLTLPQYVYKGTDCAISSSAVPLHPLWSRAPFRSHFHRCLHSRPIICWCSKYIQTHLAVPSLLRHWKCLEAVMDQSVETLQVLSEHFKSSQDRWLKAEKKSSVEEQSRLHCDVHLCEKMRAIKGPLITEDTRGLQRRI